MSLYRLLTGAVLVGLLGLGGAFTLATAQAQEGGAITMEQVNKGIAEIEKMAQEQVDTGGVPGIAVTVVFEDKIVYTKAFGVREVGKPDPVTEDTVFQLASLSKAVASTVVAGLVSDGAVTWDTPVSRIDPSIQLHDSYPTSQVTIRDLFSHRSGLGGNVGNDLEQIGYDRDTILRRLRLVEPASSFRSAYAYSNFGITAGAVAAATAAGKTWEDASDEVLYKPLGMTSTSSRYADLLKHENRASLHSRVDGKWVAAVKREPDAQSPAGGVSSNIKDLGQWARLQLAGGKFNGKQVISEAALAQTHLPTIYRGPEPFTGRPQFYGLGWNVSLTDKGEVRIGHAGAFSQGARTIASLIPSEQLGIVVLTNAFPTGVPEAIADTFFDVARLGKASRDWVNVWNDAYSSLFGPESYAAAVKLYSAPPANAAAALPNGAYVGAYRNDFIGDMQVIEQDGGLALQLGPKKMTFPIKHYDRDLFVVYLYPEIPDYPSAVRFTIGPDQKASQVVVDELNSNGQGILERVKAP